MKKLLPKFKNNPDGFTLVELLVVISIIAILSVVGITVFTGVQKNARDAKRRADIDAISKSYETGYNSLKGVYKSDPTERNALFSSGAEPKDPNGTTPYTINIPDPYTTYMICADLEGATGNATDSSGGGLGTTSTGGFYCKKNAQ